jgi:ATPase subunit of ABC transporter with duplicated ATPase domains
MATINTMLATTINVTRRSLHSMLGELHWVHANRVGQTDQMATLIARGLTLSRAAGPVLDDVDLIVAPGQRIGVIGPNGVGKSTFLAVLAAKVVLDSGIVELAPPDASVALLAQEPERSDEMVIDALARRTGVAAANTEFEAATAALATADDGGDRYDRALQRWLNVGAADFEARSAQVCSELGLSNLILQQTTQSLSGGQAARVSLATIMLTTVDVLLLDEPTNDLDHDGLARLERFVLGWQGGLVVVSHDRTFLDRIVTDVLEIDGHTHQAVRFSGGWSAYLADKATAARHAEERYDEFSTKKSTLQSRAQREREWMHRGVTTSKKKPSDNDKLGRKFAQEATEQLAGRASRTQRALERLDEVDEPWHHWELQLELKAAPRSGTRVVQLIDAVIERGTFRLGPINVEVTSGERVSIAGANGTGKSTLLAALLGHLELSEGTHWMGPSVVVGELDQARSLLVDTSNVLTGFVKATGLELSEARTLLAKFGIVADHVTRPVTSLSPGERTRLELAVLQSVGTNCLVLDEPTNHLDLTAIEQLEQALTTWTGTLLLVTHDRTFLDAIRIDRTITLS